MTVNVQGLSHIALRVTDLARAKAFYTDVLGFALMRDTPTLVLVSGYGILLGMRGDQAETPRGDRFNPYRVGLDHLALAAPNRDALAGMVRSVGNSGPCRDWSAVAADFEDLCMRSIGDLRPGRPAR